MPNDMTRLFKAYCDSPAHDSAVFVEAINRDAAYKKMVGMLALMFGRNHDDISIYNLQSWNELIDSGISDDLDLRMFECGWKGNTVVAWVSSPLFLAPKNNEFLLSKWAELQLNLAQENAKKVIPINRPR